MTGPVPPLRLVKSSDPAPATTWLAPEATVPPEHAKAAHDAVRALHDGRPAEAEMLCRLACEKGPENAELRARQAIALTRLNRREDAWSVLREGLKANPGSPALLTVQGSLHLDCLFWREGNTSALLRRVKEPEKLPQDLRVRWNIARASGLRPGKRDPEGTWLLLDALVVGIEPMLADVARSLLQEKLADGLSPAGIRALCEVFDWGGAMPAIEFVAMHGRKMKGHPDTPLIALTKMRLVMPVDVFGTVTVHIVPGVESELNQAARRLVR